MLTVIYKIECDICGALVDEDKTRIYASDFVHGNVIPKPNCRPVFGQDLCNDCSDKLAKIMTSAINTIRLERAK